MNQLNLFDTDSRRDQDGNELAHHEPQRPRYGGKTYDEARDRKRLTGAMKRVYELMRDGRKRTLSEISAAAKCSEGTAGARFRDIRKEENKDEFPNVESAESECIGGGVWVYWLVMKGTE